MNNKCIEILEKINSESGLEKIEEWVENDAGSSNRNYFMCKKEGDLKLQQVPGEYSKVLIESLKISPKSYLEIGIGNGGSWLTFSYLNKNSLEISHSVDNLSYYQAIGQKEDEINFIKDYLSHSIDDVKFYNLASDDFFLVCENKYDIIFIDGDHSYEGVKKDYMNSLKIIKEGGLMIFHDINSLGAPGVVKFWNEYKNNHKNMEFVHSNTCGMGIFYF